MSQQFASPAPLHPNYHSNIQAWSTSSTPPPRASSSRTTRRTTRGSNLAQTAQPIAAAAATATTQHQPYNAHYYQQPQHQYYSQARTNPPRAVLPTATQALHSTYSSRLRTGTTLLMQPILTNSTTAAAAGSGNAGGTGGTGGRSRRANVINYAEPGSGDELPDAGALDSDDSDFIASGGTRTAVRRMGGTRPGTFTTGSSSVFQVGRDVPSPQPTQLKTELDQSYLGMVPPSRFITGKGVNPTQHQYFTPEQLERQAQKPSGLVPIRVEFETDTHRIRDCFVWNLHEGLITPEVFARVFCTDLDLPHHPWAETVANQIRAQLEDHEGVASMDLSTIGDVGMEAVDLDREDNGGGLETIPDCRVVLSIDVQIATYHLLDHIEWDLLSPLTPEEFASKLCSELGLSGEAHPLIAHAVHEELVKHKKDAIEWGVIGGDRDLHHYHVDDSSERPRDKSGLSLLKDKTGLGLGWGRTPKDGRGPKVLKSIWRDWAEAEEFRTKFEILTAEEVERRESEKERATRRLRRETSKFQHQSTRRRRY